MTSDVFQVGNGVPANYSDGTVALSINGSKQGRKQAAGQTLGQFVDQQAKNFGIRTFTVYADGTKLLTGDASRLASSFKEIDIVAKDSRG